jgi:hypothetical protein
MSELATTSTQTLILDVLPAVFEGGSDHRWQAIKELRASADELARAGLVDTEAIREISQENSQTLGLDHTAADRVYEVRQKPAGGSLAAMHSPSLGVWGGTGGAMATTVDGMVVHYVYRAGEAEERYGHGLPYIVDKLAWLATARGIKGHQQIFNGDGYTYTANRLNRIGRKGTRPHIGSIAVHKEQIWEPYRVETPEDELLISASGTLPSEFHDVMYDLHMPELIERARADEQAGLFDGWDRNKRAGIYDIAFGEMVGRALFGDRLDDQMMSLFDIPGRFRDVDIN